MSSAMRPLLGMPIRSTVRSLSVAGATTAWIIASDRHACYAPGASNPHLDLQHGVEKGWQPHGGVVAGLVAVGGWLLLVCYLAWAMHCCVQRSSRARLSPCRP